MIPKRIQIHWFEDHFPHWVDKAINKYHEFFPGWEICVYREIPRDLPEKYRKVMENAPHPRYRADLVRWWLLYRDGGIYVDADTLPLRDFSELLDYKCFFPRLGPRRSIDIFFIGAEPGLPLFKEALEGCLNYEKGPLPGTYFYMQNVVPDVIQRPEVHILDYNAAIETLVGYDGYKYKFLETKQTPYYESKKAYIMHFCNFRVRTRPVLRPSLLDEQADPTWLQETCGSPQPYPERSPEPQPQDIAWREMPNGDLVCDPGGPRPEEAPEGYVQDAEKPYRFHPINKEG